MPEAIPSLEELTQACLPLRPELTGQITEALVAQRHGPLLQPSDHCRGPQRSASPAWLRPAPTAHGAHDGGEVSLSRPLLYCLTVRGFSPRMTPCSLCERRHSMGPAAAAARLAAEVPFQTAQELFTQLTGLSLSDHTIHTVAGELSHELGCWT